MLVSRTYVNVKKSISYQENTANDNNYTRTKNINNNNNNDT